MEPPGSKSVAHGGAYRPPLHEVDPGARPVVTRSYDHESVREPYHKPTSISAEPGHEASYHGPQIGPDSGCSRPHADRYQPHQPDPQDSTMSAQRASNHGPQIGPDSGCSFDQTRTNHPPIIHLTPDPQATVISHQSWTPDRTGFRMFV